MARKRKTPFKAKTPFKVSSKKIMLNATPFNFSIKYYIAPFKRIINSVETFATFVAPFRDESLSKVAPFKNAPNSTSQFLGSSWVVVEAAQQDSVNNTI